MAVSSISSVFSHLVHHRANICKRITGISRNIRSNPAYPRAHLDCALADLNLVDQKMYKLIHRACRAAQNPPSYMQNRNLTRRGTPNNDSPIIVSFGEALTALYVAQLGGSAIIGKVGFDVTEGLLLDSNALLNVDTYGMRSHLDSSLAWTDIDVDLIGQGNIFHCGSSGMIDDGSTQMAALSVARCLKKLVSYCPNLRQSLWPSKDAARTGIMSIWDKADIIVISKHELIFLVGADHDNDDAVIDKLFHPGMKVLIITEGSAGFKYFTRRFKGTIEGQDVQISDTDRAGHAFVAGFLTRLSFNNNLFQDRRSLEEAIKFANAAAVLLTSN